MINQTRKRLKLEVKISSLLLGCTWFWLLRRRWDFCFLCLSENVFVRARSCSSHKAKWGWLWKMESWEKEEWRRWRSWESFLSWSWEDIRVSWRQGVWKMWVCVWVKGVAVGYTIKGRYFFFLLQLRGQNGSLRGLL